LEKSTWVTVDRSVEIVNLFQILNFFQLFDLYMYDMNRMGGRKDFCPEV
jgi:hypothetical protein